MICNFIDCCIAKDTWVECETCGTKLETMAPAHKFNSLGIVCKGKPAELVGEGKSFTFPAQIVELGDNHFSKTPQLYLMQHTGNRVFLDVDRPFLIRLVRGDGDKFSVCDEVNVKISIFKK
jgi:hypothetical protein